MSLFIGAAGGALAAAVGLIGYGLLVPSSQLYGPVISCGPRDQNEAIALTFDDGPHHEVTPRVLEILSRRQVKATFFMTGRNIIGVEQIVHRVHEEGHLVANHSFAHAHSGTLRPQSYWHREMQRTNDLIYDIIGCRPALFRPPMGFKTPFVHRAAQSHGLHMVTWSRRAFDGVHTTRDRILRRLADSVRGGDIVTMHDGIDHSARRNFSASVEAIEPLITAWQQRGLQLQRLDRLIGLDPYLAG